LRGKKGGSDPERCGTRRVAGRDSKLFPVAGYERLYGGLDEKLGLKVIADRFR
jgi:hypothetical protein